METGRGIISWRVTTEEMVATLSNLQDARLQLGRNLLEVSVVGAIDAAITQTVDCLRTYREEALEIIKERCIADGQKIPAIKMVKVIDSLGLREARDVVYSWFPNK